METSAALAIRRYRLLPESLPAAEQRVRDRHLIPYVAIVATCFLISTFLAFRKTVDLASILPLAVIAGLILTYLFFVIPRRTRKVLARCWNSYTLEIGPDYLLRQQADTPDVRLPFSEIKRIERRPGDYVRVVGTKKLHVIGIPHGIEHFDEIWQTLAGLAPVTEHASDHFLGRHLITVVAGAGFLGMFWSTSPRIVLPIAAALVGILVWGMVFLRRSPNASRQSRRAIWLYVWLIFLVGMKVLSVLSQLRKH